MESTKVYAVDLKEDVIGRISAEDLRRVITSGALSVADLAGWSWLTIREHGGVTVFANVARAAFVDKLTIHSTNIHPESKIVMDMFDGRSVSKSPSEPWRSNMYFDTGIASPRERSSADCLGFCSAFMVITSSPTLWLLAELIEVTQQREGYISAGIEIERAGMTTVPSGHMPLLRIVPGKQTDEYWKSSAFAGFLVLTEFNTCIIE